MKARWILMAKIQMLCATWLYGGRKGIWNVVTSSSLMVIRLEAYMVLIAASIPTLRPLVKGVGSVGSRGDRGKLTSYALRNLNNDTIGSTPRRNKGRKFDVLSDSLQASASEEQLNMTVGVSQGSFQDYSECSEGINKTTTVTVTEQLR